MMKNIRYFSSLPGLIFFLLLAMVWNAEAGASLPEGFKILTDFKPGMGKSVGRVHEARGEVVLIHAQENLGYSASTETPIFMQDTVITQENSRAVLQFLDKSTLSIAASTRLVINRAVYDPENQDRSTFLGLPMGKIRFLIKKLPGFSRSEFKVKTKTVVAGVRGSDFVIIASDRSTEIIALDHTVLEVMSLAEPGKYVVITTNQRVLVNAGQPVSKVESISPEKAKQLRQEFPFLGEQTELMSDIIESIAASSNKLGQGPSATGGSIPKVDQSKLVSPEELDDPRKFEPPVSEFVEPAGNLSIEPETVLQDAAGNVIENTTGINTLPGMPGTP
jgi:hypothetical protein